MLTLLVSGTFFALVFQSRSTCTDDTHHESRAEGCPDSPVHGSAMLQVQRVKLASAWPDQNASDVSGPSLSSLHDGDQAESEKVNSNVTAADARLTEKGFRQVSAQCCELVMEEFIRRLIRDLEMTLCYEGGLNGFIPFLVCNKKYTLESVTKELVDAAESKCPWVSYEEKTCWSKPWPEDCQGKYDGSAHRRRSCQNKKSASPSITTSKAPTTMPPSTTGEVYTCLPNPVALDLSKSSVTQNNLGGMGPNFADSEELRYSGIGEYNGLSLDLVITTTGQGYKPSHSDQNGRSPKHHKLGRINIGAGIPKGQNGKADLRFTIEFASTKLPVKLPGFYMTFLDIDQPHGDNSNLRESYTFQGHSRAIYDKQSKDIHVEETISMTTALDVIKVESTKSAHACDGPSNPDNLGTVTCKGHVVDQMKRSVMLVFENVASFEMSFEMICTECIARRRNIFFATKSSMTTMCATQKT